MVTEKEEVKKEDFELPESQKYKLTLGIDREIVRKAKIAGINISFLTEQLLRAMTSKPTEDSVTHREVVDSYHTFFNEISKIVDEYGIWVSIGEQKVKNGWTRNLFLLPYNTLRTDSYDEKGEYRVSDRKQLDKALLSELTQHKSLYKPANIIENLLTNIKESTLINKNKIKEVKLALRVLKVLTENNENNNNQESNGGKKE